LCSQV